MPIILKTPQEIEKMRVAGQLAAEVLRMIEPHVKAGISTEELDSLCHDYIVNVQKAIPAPLNYKGFPKSICTSVNHQVCHGIPSPKQLKKGDIINVDITIIKDGYHGDVSKMFFIGKPSVAAERVVRIAYECLVRAIHAIKPGATFGDMGYAIQHHAESHGLSVVRDYCGHGIGLSFHEEPQVLHYGKPGSGAAFVIGMTFTIEPMINVGRYEVKCLADKWTVVTKDHSLSAQWEHTVAITEKGCEILTLLPDETL